MYPEKHVCINFTFLPLFVMKSDTHITVAATNVEATQGMIVNEGMAPFVRTTLPNPPSHLFAVPFAGMVKLVKGWLKWAYISPSAAASVCANVICIRVLTTDNRLHQGHLPFTWVLPQSW
jgi:hypothetical protein